MRRRSAVQQAGEGKDLQGNWVDIWVAVVLHPQSLDYSRSSKSEPLVANGCQLPGTTQLSIPIPSHHHPIPAKYLSDQPTPRQLLQNAQKDFDQDPALESIVILGRR